MNKVLIIGICLVIMFSVSSACSKPPTAQIVASTTNGQAPLSITFTNKSINAEQFRWDFGDGTTTVTDSVEEFVTHEYTKAGNHTVTLTAKKEGKTVEVDTATIDIIVEHGVLDSVKLIPSSLEINVNESQQFIAEATDAYGNPIPNAQIVWEVESGAGSITNDGIFTAGKKTGNVITVIATLNGVSIQETASISLNAGPLHHVNLIPGSVEMYSGESQQFTAEAFDSYDIPITDVQLAWEVLSGDGTISSDGIFTAGTGNGLSLATINVIAESNGLSVSTTGKVIILEGFKYMTYLGLNTEPMRVMVDGQWKYSIREQVCQAISFCIDRDDLSMFARDIYNNEAQKILSIVSPSHSNTFINPSRDIEKAQPLMTEAHYPNGFKADFFVGSKLVYIAERIATHLEELNIQVEIHVRQDHDMVRIIQPNDHNIFFYLMEIDVDFIKTHELLGRLFLCDSAENHIGYSNPDFDQLFNSGLYNEAENEAFRDNITNIFPLYWSR